mmetsp:Transcript_30326/g.54921  ORF Transcript_30326/g.54921 Transcript_30326/m.54921 type:complete len:204 (-) Transcript_30326:81-692(-)
MKVGKDSCLHSRRRTYRGESRGSWSRSSKRWLLPPLQPRLQARGPRASPPRRRSRTHPSHQHSSPRKSTCSSILESISCRNVRGSRRSWWRSRWRARRRVMRNVGRGNWTLSIRVRWETAVERAKRMQAKTRRGMGQRQVAVLQRMSTGWSTNLPSRARNARAWKARLWMRMYPTGLLVWIKRRRRVRRRSARRLSNCFGVYV